MPNGKEMGPGGPSGSQIEVTATYAPARKPFQDKFADEASLGEVKGAIMTAFGVSEGPAPNGGQVVFQLFDKDGELTDMTRTIADVAAPGRHAKLNLVKQIIQGH